MNPSSGRTVRTRLIRNTAWNLFGLTAPLAVAVFAIPALIRSIGTDRFGVLTLAWGLIGYCSLFDFGMGRVLTKLVAESPAGAPNATLGSRVWTALLAITGFGTVGGGLLVVCARPLVAVLKIPESLVGETVLAFWVVAGAIPIVTLTAGLRGILEARQRFASLSLLQSLVGTVTFLGPLVVSRTTVSLPALLAVLAVTRLASAAAHAALCRRAAGDLFHNRRIDPPGIVPLLKYGGWLTVSSVLSPLMVYMDRYLVAGLLSVSSVAFYVTPYDIVTRLNVVPNALSGALFPALSLSVRQDLDATRRIYVRSLFLTAAALAFPCLVLVLGAGPLLGWWVGSEFAQKSVRVAQFLAAGVFINALAYVPSRLLQASGRPDLTAKLHMLELPFYLVLAAVLIRKFGIDGAAVAWTVRVTVDAILLFVLGHLEMRQLGRRMPLALGPDLC